jgi:uncharacterized protein
MKKPGSTPRTKIKRVPDRSVSDPVIRNEILDDSVLAHVAITDDSGQPFVLPMAFARDGERLLLHGSTKSRLMRSLAAGTLACVEVTILDGLVLSRSAFESSMNYRSVVALGVGKELSGKEKEKAFEVLTEKIFPGRVAEVRATKPDEIKATLIVEFPLTETSVKIRSGPHEDRPEDLDLPIWAGVIPLKTIALAPIAGDEKAEKLEIPQSVRDLVKNPPQT